MFLWKLTIGIPHVWNCGMAMPEQCFRLISFDTWVADGHRCEPELSQKLDPGLRRNPNPNVCGARPSRALAYMSSINGADTPLPSWSVSLNVHVSWLPGTMRSRKLSIDKVSDFIDSSTTTDTVLTSDL